MKLEIYFKNGGLNVIPTGDNLSQGKVLETLALSYAAACSNLGVDFVTANAFIRDVIMDNSYDKDALDARLERVQGDELYGIQG